MADEIRLSPQQRRLWQVAEAAGTALRARAELALSGDLDAGLLFEVLEELVARHEILRTTFEPRPWLKVPLQVIAETGTVAWAPAGVPLEARETDLGRGPLFQAALASGPDSGHLLTLELPALCCDLRSLANLAMEIERDYAARRGAPAEEPGEPLQYADFSEWQHELLAGEDPSAAAGRAFWEKQDLAPARSLRLPCEREARGRFQPEEIPLDLGGLVRAVEETARAAGASAAAVLLAAWAVLLWRLSGRPEIVVGYLFDGRKYEDLQDGIGAFSRCLPVRVLPNPRIRFRDLVAQVEGVLREAGEWQEYCDPEESLQLSGGDLVSPSGFELAEVRPGRRGAPLAVSVRRLSAWTERFHVKLSCLRAPDGLSAALGFDAAVLDPDGARRLGRQLLAVLERATADPEVLAGDVDVAPAEDLRLAASLNATAAPLPAPRCFHQLFAEQAARTPELTALVFEEESLTYAELAGRANRLAHHLAALGVGPDVRVALLLERSPEMVVALLGTLAAGGAYVPLDPSYPADRLAAMLDDSGAAAVVTLDRLAGSLPAGGPPVVRLDADAGAIASRPASGRRRGSGRRTWPTSSSPPAPRDGPRAWRWSTAALATTSHCDRARAAAGGRGWLSPPSRPSGRPGQHGGLPLPGLRRPPARPLPGADPDAAAVAGTSRGTRSTFLKIVPLPPGRAGGRRLRALPRRALVLGGEAAEPELVDRLRALESPAAQPSTGRPRPRSAPPPAASTAGRPADAGRLPLGRPLANTRVLRARPDALQRPVPGRRPRRALHRRRRGGAAATSAGRTLTAERFVPDPFARRAGRAALPHRRPRPPGCRTARLEFLGRADHQVKVRGFRIELGRDRGRPAAASGGARGGGGRPRGRPGRPPARRLRVPATGRAPARRRPSCGPSCGAGCPTTWCPRPSSSLDALPLTPNGKVDRKALPAPGGGGRGAAADSPRPARRREELLAADLGARCSGSSGSASTTTSSSSAATRSWPSRSSRAPARRGCAHPAAALRAPDRRRAGRVGRARPRDPGRAGAGDRRGAADPDPALVLRPRTGRSRTTSTRPWCWSPASELDPAPLAAALARPCSPTTTPCACASAGAEEWRQDGRAPDGGRSRSSGSTSPRWPTAEREAAARGRGGAGPGRSRPRPRARCCGPPVRPRRRSGAPAPARRPPPGRRRRLLAGAAGGPEHRAAASSRRAGQSPCRPRPPRSRQWAERLAGHARAGALEAELAYWLRRPPRPRRRCRSTTPPRGDDGEASGRTVSVALGAEETGACCRRSRRLYRTQINDVLLAALAARLRRLDRRDGAAVSTWRGTAARSSFDDVDLSRTVGWFTTLFPVRLERAGRRRSGEALQAVKEQLRAIPDRGPRLRPAALPGRGRRPASAGCAAAAGGHLQLPRAARRRSLDGSPFAPGREPAGPAREPAGERRRYLLQINAGSCWTAGCGSTGPTATAATAARPWRRWREGFLAAPAGAARHCRRPGAARPTPPRTSRSPGSDQAAIDRLCWQRLAGSRTSTRSRRCRRGCCSTPSTSRARASTSSSSAACWRGTLDVAAFEAGLAAGRRPPPDPAHRLRLGGARPAAPGGAPAGRAAASSGTTGRGAAGGRARGRAARPASPRTGSAASTSAAPPLMRLALVRAGEEELPVALEPPPPAARRLVARRCCSRRSSRSTRRVAGGRADAGAGAAPSATTSPGCEEQDLAAARGASGGETLRGLHRAHSAGRRPRRPGGRRHRPGAGTSDGCGLAAARAAALQAWRGATSYAEHRWSRAPGRCCSAATAADEDVVFGATVSGRPAELRRGRVDGRPVHQHAAGAGPGGARGGAARPGCADLQARQAELRQHEHTPAGARSRAGASCRGACRCSRA